MKRAILTGATGAVGSALIKELIKNDIEVLVLCRENSVRNCNIPIHPLVTKEYCDLSELNVVTNKTGKIGMLFSILHGSAQLALPAMICTCKTRMCVTH